MTERKRGGKASATRGQLLDAALRVIGEKGYSAATVDEIVEAAGVSKGVAYYHFKNKAAMAESILTEGMGGLVESFEGIAERAADAPEALTGMIELFAQTIFDNKSFGRFFVSELWRESREWSGSMREHEERLLGLLESQFERGRREGVLRANLDSGFASVAVVGLVLTTALYYVGDDAPAASAAGGVASTDAAMPEDAAASAGETASAGAAAATGVPLAGAAAGGPLDKEAFVARIVSLVSHAIARPDLLVRAAAGGQA